MFKKAPGDFKIVNTDGPHCPPGMTRAFSNNRYIVMIYDNIQTTHGPCIQCLVQTIHDKPILNHWSEMQNIKNKIFGEEVEGVEYYPKESELIDRHNIYWMWIFPEGVLPKKICK